MRTKASERWMERLEVILKASPVNSGKLTAFLASG